MSTENNQAAATNAADSPRATTNDQLAALGESLGFTREQPSQAEAAPATQDDGETPQEQPTVESGVENEEMELDPTEDPEANQGEPEENQDPLALLFDDDVLYDVGDDEPVNGLELKNRLLRQSDYTKKTQELAQERETINQERADYGNNLAFFDHVNQAALSEFSRVDWNTLQMQDPAQYQRLAQDYQRLQQRQQQIHTARDQFINHATQEQQQQIEAAQVATIERLRPSIPDIDTRLDGVKQLAKDYGFDDAELPSMLADERALRVLLDAQTFKSAKQQSRDKLKPQPMRQPKPKANAVETGRKQTEKARLTNAANKGDQNAARALLRDRLSNVSGLKRFTN